MAQNQATYFIDSALIAARELELPNANFADGANKAASNAPGIGINTGDHSPTESSWSQIEQVAESQLISEAKSGINTEDATFGQTALVGFGPADAITAPDAPMTVDVAGSGFDTVNRTGESVPSAAWTWGAINNP